MTKRATALPAAIPTTCHIRDTVLKQYLDAVRENIIYLLYRNGDITNNRIIFGGSTTLVREGLGIDIDRIGRIYKVSFRPDKRTLEVVAAGAHKGKAQLVDVDTVSAGDLAIPYYDQANAVLKWIVPDANKAAPTMACLYMDPLTGLFQFYNWATAPITAGIADTDILMWRDASGFLRYTTVATVLGLGHDRLHDMDDVLDHSGGVIGDLIYGSAVTAGKWDKLAANASTTIVKYLRSYSAVGASAPSWEQVSHTELSDVDTDASASAIHHTLGTGATQAAAGDHAHTAWEILVHAADSKTTPADADEMGLADSEATFGLKKLTWANLKATLKTYFDTLYATAASIFNDAEGDPANVGTTAADGTSGYASRRDHVHALPGATVASVINSATGKTTPADADEIGISDSEATYGWKKLTWANIKATLKTYFDTLYALTGHTHAQLHDRKHDIDGTDDHNGLASFTENNFLASNAAGLPKDSGSKASDFSASDHTHAQLHDRKHDLDGTDDHNGISGTENNFMAINASGLPKDSGSKAGDFATSDHSHAQLHDRLHAADSQSDHNGSTPGDLLYGIAGGFWARLAANAAAQNKYLRQISGGAPSWEQIAYGDISGTPVIPAVPTHKLKWFDGTDYTDDQPMTPAGHYWFLAHIYQPGATTEGDPAAVPADEVWHVNMSTCLEIYNRAGWIDYDSPQAGILFTNSDGDNVTVTVIAGLVTDPVSGSIYATRTDTGDTVELAIQGDGTVTGYVGEIQVLDADSGETIYVRVTSAGHITR